MNIDVLHAKKNAERFHKTTLVLAEKATGVYLKDIIENRIKTLPIIIGNGDKIAIYYEGVKSRDDGDTDFITPYVVNASFSLELHFKVLNYLESSNWLHGHNLSAIFNKLSQKSKALLIDEFDRLVEKSDVYNKMRESIQKEFDIPFEWSFQDLLEKSSKAFENWRYPFQLKPAWFAGYKEIQLALMKGINKIEAGVC